MQCMQLGVEVERMEIAKVTSKGQITIPVDVRRKLDIKEGDKVLFVEEGGRVFIMNSSLDAWRKTQAAMAGEAERLGLSSEQDVIDMVNEVREQRWKEARDADNG